MQRRKISIKLNIIRSDLSATPKKELTTIQLSNKLTVDQLKRHFYGLLKAEPSNVTLKLRDKNEILIPISMLLQQPNEKMIYSLEVIRTHQNLIAEKRNHYHEIYMEATQSKIDSLNKRLSKIETLIPQFRLRQQIQHERAIISLCSTVAFLDRRINQLMPSHWNDQCV